MVTAASQRNRQVQCHFLISLISSRRAFRVRSSRCSPSSSAGSTPQYAHFFAGGVQRAGSKGFNTEATGRTTEFTEQKTMTLRAKRRDSCLLRELRGPRLFPPCWNPCFLESNPGSGRTPMSLVPDRQAAAGGRGTAYAELNQTASCEPGDTWPGWDV